jgi:DNA-binding CsgD family transcriptional regulator
MTRAGGDAVVGRTDFVEAVMDVVSDALIAINDGTSAQEVVCAGLCQAFHATCSAYVHHDVLNGEIRVVCWPPGSGIEALAELSGSSPAHPPADYHRRGCLEPASISRRVTDPMAWHESGFFQVLQTQAGCTDVAELPLMTTCKTRRTVAIARPYEFTPTDLELLRIAQRPLVALDRHMLNAERQRAPAQLLTSDPPDPTASAAGHSLTHRELEVLSLLAQGLMARSIAARLDLSPRTVHKHLGSIYQKLGSHDRLVAVIRAREVGLLPADRTAAQASPGPDGPKLGPAPPAPR